MTSRGSHSNWLWVITNQLMDKFWELGMTSCLHGWKSCDTFLITSLLLNEILVMEEGKIFTLSSYYFFMWCPILELDTTNLHHSKLQPGMGKWWTRFMHIVCICFVSSEGAWFYLPYFFSEVEAKKCLVTWGKWFVNNINEVQWTNYWNFIKIGEQGSRLSGHRNEFRYWWKMWKMCAATKRLTGICSILSAISAWAFISTSHFAVEVLCHIINFFWSKVGCTLVGNYTKKTHSWNWSRFFRPAWFAVTKRLHFIFLV